MNQFSHALKEIFDLQKYAIKLGLNNITKLSQFLDNPHLAYPTIHIAGTNGKGSTAIILQKVLMNHGLKVGLYTSPHLVKYNERIRIDDQLIEDQFIIDFWNNSKNLVNRLKATFFDLTTCMAFEYFKQKEADVAIFETGLGGRLDSTNIIHPEAAIITPIGFDHQKQLGNTLTQIAAEKAGIIKQNCTLFLGYQQQEVLSYFENEPSLVNDIVYQGQRIASVNIQLGLDKTVFSFTDTWRNLRFEKVCLYLLGAHQVDNACLAYLAGRWYLEKKKILFNEHYFTSALSTVTWPGRLQKISSSPDIYIDVSHNADGFKKFIEFISAKFKNKKLHLLLGLLEDKNYSEIIHIVKDHFQTYTITEPENHRRLSGSVIIDEFAKHGINAKFIKDVSKAFEISIKDLQKNELLFIIGSHYLTGSIFSKISKIT